MRVYGVIGGMRPDGIITQTLRDYLSDTVILTGIFLMVGGLGSGLDIQVAPFTGVAIKGGGT